MTSRTPVAAEGTNVPVVGRLGYQPSLDGLRAVAIAMVVLFHGWWRHFPGGYLGVEVFFVLSGFLITWLLLEESHRSGRIRFGAFYLRRAYRLLPALLGLEIVYAVVALGFVGPGERHTMLASIPVTVTYGSNWLAAAGHPLGPGFGQMWSLAIEEQFYLVWPVLLWLVLRRWGLSGVARLALGGAVALLLLREVLWRSGFTAHRVYYGSDTRGAALLLGCGVGWVVATGHLRVTGLRRQALTATVGLFAIYLALAFLGHEPRIPGMSPEAPLTVVDCGTAVVLIWLWVPASDLVRRLLAARPAVFIGRRSYGLYLWHLPVIELARRLTPGGLAGWAMPMAVAGSVLAAAASYRWIEQPVLVKARTRRELSLHPTASGSGAPVRHQPRPDA